jgi:CBS-domain-containing membrane protein
LVCKSSHSIQTALHTMSEGKVRRLPVVGDNAQLVGILSMDDVVLNAERGTAKVGSVISSAAVVKTLQAIYARDNQPIAEAVAA